MRQLVKTPFPHALARGEKQVGLWISLCSTFVAEVTAAAGYDWARIKPAAAALDVLNQARERSAASVAKLERKT